MPVHLSLEIAHGSSVSKCQKIDGLGRTIVHERSQRAQWSSSVCDYGVYFVCRHAEILRAHTCRPCGLCRSLPSGQRSTQPRCNYSVTLVVSSKLPHFHRQFFYSLFREVWAWEKVGLIGSGLLKINSGVKWTISGSKSWFTFSHPRGCWSFLIAEDGFTFRSRNISLQTQGEWGGNEKVPSSRCSLARRLRGVCKVKGRSLLTSF